jgi:hypothetical protein
MTNASAGKSLRPGSGSEGSERWRLNVARPLSDMATYRSSGPQTPRRKRLQGVISEN